MRLARHLRVVVQNADAPSRIAVAHQRAVAVDTTAVVRTAIHQLPHSPAAASVPTPIGIHVRKPKCRRTGVEADACARRRRQRAAIGVEQRLAALADGETGRVGPAVRGRRPACRLWPAAGTRGCRRAEARSGGGTNRSQMWPQQRYASASSAATGPPATALPPATASSARPAQARNPRREVERSRPGPGGQTTASALAPLGGGHDALELRSAAEGALGADGALTVDGDGVPAARGTASASQTPASRYSSKTAT